MHRTQIQNEPKPPFPKQRQRSPGLQSQMMPEPLYKAPLYKAAGKLVGKNALITGGDSGIGRSVAYLYKRPAPPEEIAPVYVFLASDADSSYVSGAIISEMGGEPD